MKVYKKMLIIELKDGTILRSEKSLLELKNYIERCKDICMIDDMLFHKFEFKKAYEQKFDDIQSYVATFTKDIQEKIRQREKEKKSRIGRGFDSIEEIDNWLKKNRLVISD